MYSDTRRITQEKLDAAFTNRTAVNQGPVPAELLDRLRAGLFDSGYTPHSIIEMARDEFGA